MSIDLNTQPYYDDFEKTKKFYRILFNPAIAVQARELTQLQTILQKQVGNLADHLFEKGAMVIPGQIAFDGKMDYVKLEDEYLSQAIDVDDFNGKTVTGQTSGVEARVFRVATLVGAQPLFTLMLPLQVQQVRVQLRRYNQVYITSMIL